MNDTTLIIPAWRRPEYLRRSLDSWQAAKGFGDLRRVVIALGRGHEKQMMPVIGGLEVLADSDRAAAVYGPHAAIGEALDAVFADPGCGFAIVSDEDVIVSDDVLAYFAWARDQGADAVCAHNYLGQGWCPPWDDELADQAAVRMCPEFTGWTWGIPRQAWEQVFRPEWDWEANTGQQPAEHGFDWQCHRLARRGLRVAIPDASRCQNIGQHDGVYAQPGQFALTLAASFRERRGDTDYRLVSA